MDPLGHVHTQNALVELAPIKQKDIFVLNFNILWKTFELLHFLFMRDEFVLIINFIDNVTEFCLQLLLEVLWEGFDFLNVLFGQLIPPVFLYELLLVFIEAFDHLRVDVDALHHLGLESALRNRDFRAIGMVRIPSLQPISRTIWLWKYSGLRKSSLLSLNF